MASQSGGRYFENGGNGRWVTRVIAGLVILGVTGLTTITFAHIGAPDHAVAKERMDNFDELQKSRAQAVAVLDTKLDSMSLQLSAQTAILKSIDKRLNTLEQRD